LARAFDESAGCAFSGQVLAETDTNESFDEKCVHHTVEAAQLVGTFRVDVAIAVRETRGIMQAKMVCVEQIKTRSPPSDQVLVVFIRERTRPGALTTLKPPAW
jgi:hypothetical protein